VAEGLSRLLDSIRRGELTAGPGTVDRLEGAPITVWALAEARGVTRDDFENG